MSNSHIPEDRIPVIVGVGEIVDRPNEIAAGLEPLDLLEQALKRAVTLGVFRPITVYPLYESATSAHWGQSPREALQESGDLWSTYSSVAAQNPNSWLKRSFKPDEITTPTPDNRLIAWPYTKLMVANPTVNMGGALLLTSLGKAREAGISQDKLIYAWGGASAEE